MKHPTADAQAGWCRRLLIAALATGLASVPSTLEARVKSVIVESREDVLGGRIFGNVGSYEKLRGTVVYELDPNHPANAGIVDLTRAPRTGTGTVEARGTFLALRPRDPGKARGVALVEVPNRGGTAALAYFAGGSFSSDPTTPADFGDGLLLRQGLTILWVGWQFDVPRRGGTLRLEAPVVTEGGRPIEGLVRSDFVVEQRATTVTLGHRAHIPYPVVDPAHPDNVLTVRSGRLAPRRIVPREAWRFAREETGRFVDDPAHLAMPGSFEPGKIYELVYRARDPVGVGLGLAAVRDVMAHAKHDPTSPFPVATGIAVGISQTGRFLRHFLYEGFNADEAGRRVFDGLLIHTAGAGRGSFNHRFAQPSRDAHRFSSFFYPTDLFPFTSRTQLDPATGRHDGLLARVAPEHRPKTILTNTGYEYWGRAASLLHTTVEGGADIAPMENERIYHLAGGQHFVGAFPPPETERLPGSPGYRGNPLDFLPALRALLVALVQWVVAGQEPPPSAYPRISEGTLVPVSRLRFPRIPGLEAPRVVHEAHRLDYGPNWRDGIVTVEPPRVGPAFPSLVPQVDASGNELGGVRALELQVPLATYAPWSLRVGMAEPRDELVDFVGTWIPFQRTAAERRAAGDPRPSIADLYASRAAYLRAAASAAAELVRARLLLPEDVARVMRRADATWDVIERRPRWRRGPHEEPRRRRGDPALALRAGATRRRTGRNLDPTSRPLHAGVGSYPRYTEEVMVFPQYRASPMALQPLHT
ncbi:MAG: alpha/beta hydrolase domain-containing protein [Candidatus Rokuibacteriota bacterium]